MMYAETIKIIYLDLTAPRSGLGVAVLHGGETDGRSSEHLDGTTNSRVRGPARIAGQSCCGLALFQGQLWAVGGIST